MTSLLLELLPSALGLALTPTAIAVGILLLGSTRPIANDGAFTAAFAVVYALVSVLVLGAARWSDEPLVSEHGKNVAALLVGVLLLLLALGTWFRARNPRRQPGRHRGLLDRVRTLKPATAFGLGLTVAVLNPNVPILLGGLTVIAAADVSDLGQGVAALLLVAAAVSGLAGPLGWYVSHRESAERRLAGLESWITRHERALDLGVLLVFGALFTLMGLVGLV